MFYNKIMIIIIFLFIYSYNYYYLKYYNLKKRIGVIGLDHSQNVWNNLIKFAIFIKLKELGFNPFIVGRQFENQNISFIENTTNIKLIKNFSEINENDYDILMVNSDQTWRRWDENFYNIAFLKFAEKWKVPKFIYGTSLGFEEWKFTKEDEKIAKYLLKNFKGISVREKYAVELIKKFLGFEVQYVLDPTFLIDKKIYLDLIKNYQSNVIKEINNDNYIFVYIIIESNIIQNYIKYVSKALNLKIFYINMFQTNQVKEFLYGIINCKAVITDSFHGTVFSIIFKKPFVSFVNFFNDRSRFNNLDEIFNISNRIFDLNSTPSISLLNQPIDYNPRKLIKLRIASIDYLKKNLFW